LLNIYIIIAVCEMIETKLDRDSLKSEIETSLKTFTPISLQEVGKVRLMDRVDRKFVLPVALLPEIFRKSESSYFIQEINVNRMAGYSTLYYDTPDFFFYHSHVNGKRKRTKIRIRRYEDTDKQFLEAKLKSNKGRTTKLRIEREDFGGLDKPAYSFLQKHIEPLSAYDLHPVLTNNFRRVTLVSKTFDERITIDFNLSFQTANGQEMLKAPDLGIIEIKQNKRSYSSLGIILRDLRVKQVGISKYCLGISQLFSEVKKNRYKQKIRSFEKVIDGKFIISEII